MRIIQKRDTFYNGFRDSDMPLALSILQEYIDVFEAIKNETAHVRFVDGDRKGSIAKIRFDEKHNNKSPIICRKYDSWDKELTHKFENIRFSGILTWTGRKNKVHCTLWPYGCNEFEILLDYDGPTVWEKFDAKEAKNKILENPNQKDIKGNILAIGDTVLYINARYGHRMVLDEGKIIEFDASVNSKGHTITTIIENASGEISSLQYPEDMIYKLA